MANNNFMLHKHNLKCNGKNYKVVKHFQKLLTRINGTKSEVVNILNIITPDLTFSSIQRHTHWFYINGTLKIVKIWIFGIYV